jgi:arsenate reductase (glutaredoxin)
MTIQAKLYWLPHCSTCQKAKAYLEAKGVTFSFIQDIKANPLSQSQLEALVSMVGDAEALFSKRALKFRALGLHEQTLSADQLIHHMATEYTFIKRPVVVFEADNKLFAGFSAKQYDAYLASLG